MSNRGEFLFRFISDFWLRVAEYEVFSLYWDAIVRQVSNVFLQIYNIDVSRAIFDMAPLFRREWQTFRFDETTQVQNPQSTPTGFPYTYQIEDSIVSIQNLHTNPDPTGEISDPGDIFYENIDYVILEEDNVIAFAALPPQYLHSNKVFSDQEMIYRNFGILVNYPNPFEFSTDLYLAQVQGLWTALWNGGTLANIELGMHILLGFPFMSPGTVGTIQANPDGSYIVYVSDTFGDNRPIEVPALLAPPTVSTGDVVDRFTPLGTGITATDYIDDLEFMLEQISAGQLHRSQIFFTMVIVLSQDAYQAALDIFGEEFITSTLPLIQTFIDNIKPEFVDMKFTPTREFEEEFTLDDGDPEDFEIDVLRRLTSTVLDNYTNVLGEGTPSYDLDNEAIQLEDYLEIVWTDGTNVVVETV